MFNKTDIRDSKKGTHSIDFGTGPVETVTVSRVRDRFVWVRLENGEEVRLNQNASRKLIEGDYRL